MPPKKKTQNTTTISTSNITAEMETQGKKAQVKKNTKPIEQPVADVSPAPLVNETIKNETTSKEQELMEEHFDNLYLSLASFKQSISTMSQHLKLLERDMKKELRNLRKVSNKSKAKGNRKPSGFAKPSDVSVELCTFMGREKGTQIARTEVTQYLINYIKEHQLQFAENKKVILPDTKLKSLLGVDDKTQVTYFNLQGLMNKHFVR